MKNSIYKLILSAVMIFSAVIILNSCSKADAINDISSPSNAQSAQRSNINVPGSSLLNTDLMITSAKDDGADISAQFRDMTFHFTDNGATSGPAAAWNNILTVNGTWNMENGHDNITLSFPTNILAQLAFMNKKWMVDGSGGNYILTAANGENDMVTLSTKD